MVKKHKILLSISHDHDHPLSSQTIYSIARICHISQLMYNDLESAKFSAVVRFKKLNCTECMLCDLSNGIFLVKHKEYNLVVQPFLSASEQLTFICMKCATF